MMMVMMMMMTLRNYYFSILSFLWSVLSAFHSVICHRDSLVAGADIRGDSCRWPTSGSFIKGCKQICKRSNTVADGAVSSAREVKRSLGSRDWCNAMQSNSIRWHWGVCDQSQSSHFAYRRLCRRMALYTGVNFVRHLGTDREAYSSI